MRLPATQDVASGSGFPHLESVPGRQVTRVPNPSPVTRADLALATALIFPSLAIFRMPGWAFAWTYAIGVLTALWLLKRYLVPGLTPRIGPTTAAWILSVVLLALIAAHLYVHARIDTTGFELAGISVGPSDGDDALDDALSRLFAGKYPYHVLTFLGQPITPMPGALLAAAPFHLLGRRALQNLFWLGVFALLLARFRADIRAATWVLGIALVLSQVIVDQLMQGTDYAANNIYVLVAVVGFVRFARGGRLWPTLAPTAVLGLALSSRLNFLLILPVVLLPLYREYGVRFATHCGAAVAAGFLAVTLPFYLYDPSGFSPFGTSGIAARIPGLPYSQLLVPGVAGAWAMVLGLRPGAFATERVIRNCFLVQLLLVAGSLLVTALEADGIQLRYAHFGVLFMFFGLFACGPTWVEEAVAPRTEAEPALSPAG